MIMTKTPSPYMRQPNYYETDQMGIIHHSNYIRWFEEARIDFFAQIGLPYEKIEAAGILIPVLSVSCEYCQAVHFHEEIEIHSHLKKFNGIKMAFAYEVIGAQTGILHTTGSSSHCFTTKELRPLSLKKNMPDAYKLLLNYIE